MEQKLKKKQDFGFTLIELLLAVILTSIFAGTLIQVTAQATKSIESITQKAVTVQTAIRYSNQIKYDFSGSQDVFIHGVAYPAGSANVCSSYNSADPTNTWRTPQVGKKYVRGLFTIKIGGIPINYNSEVFTPAVPIFVGYEIRRSGLTSSPPYELWRVECTFATTTYVSGGGTSQAKMKVRDITNLVIGMNLVSGTGLTPAAKITAIDLTTREITMSANFSAQASQTYTFVLTNIPPKLDKKLLDLGAAGADISALSMESPQSSYISCHPYVCSQDASTKLIASFYKFKLPYNGNMSVLNKLNNTENQQLHSRIDN